MLTLTEDQVLLKDAAKGWLTERSPVAALRRLRDERVADGFDRTIWNEMAEMGWTGVLVPEGAGGSGFGFVGAGLVCEEMGRTLTASPFISTAMMAATALNRAGTTAQRERLLPLIATGRTIVACAVDETRRHDPAGVALSATRAGNGFRLTGQKTFVTDGASADQIIVAARTGGSPGERAGLTLFLIEQGVKGLTAERTSLLDSRTAARLSFEGVEATGADVIGEVDEGADLLDVMLDAGRVGLASELNGVAGESFERTVAYLRERRQFGKIVGSFQALQHRAAHLFSDIEMARSAMLAALQAMDEDPAGAALMVSVAKAKAAQTARLAGLEAIQMHGGIGMTDAIDIGLFVKRMQVAGELYGDADFHADRVARLRGF